MNSFAERTRMVLRLARRSLLATAILAVGLTAGSANAASQAAQRIAQHFSNVRTMTGEFVQFGPRGEQTGGKFYIERPGKIRFDYEPPAQFRVMSDGSTVVLENKKMNTVDIYRLSDTPLRLHPVARRSLHAHLIKLERDGRVTEKAGAWLLRGTAATNK